MANPSSSIIALLSFMSGAILAPRAARAPQQTSCQLFPQAQYPAPKAHKASPRAPKIFYGAWEQVRPINVVTTDFFAFDDTTNYYGLQGRGSAVEMGDAVLGLAINDLGRGAPRWTAIRNASDPQMDGAQSLADQTKTAAQIYEKYGYWTTVCSAIATWAVIGRGLSCSVGL